MVVNRIRENIATVEFPVVKHITISAGVCELGEDREKALALAEQLLYRAKLHPVVRKIIRAECEGVGVGHH